MRNTLFLVGILLTMLTSCNKFQGDQEMQVGETISDSNVNLKFLSYEDTRCPIGATCIQAGEVWVNLQITDRNGASESFSLGNDTYPLSEVHFGYNIEFKSLTPHPEAGVVIGIADIKLQLSITSI